MPHRASPGIAPDPAPAAVARGYVGPPIMPRRAVNCRFGSGAKIRPGRGAAAAQGAETVLRLVSSRPRSRADPTSRNAQTTRRSRADHAQAMRTHCITAGKGGFSQRRWPPKKLFSPQARRSHAGSRACPGRGRPDRDDAQAMRRSRASAANGPPEAVLAPSDPTRRTLRGGNFGNFFCLA